MFHVFMNSHTYVRLQLCSVEIKGQPSFRQSWQRSLISKALVKETCTSYGVVWEDMTKNDQCYMSATRNHMLGKGGFTWELDLAGLLETNPLSVSCGVLLCGIVAL